MGSSDEREHKRRDKKISEIESDSDEQPKEYPGKMTFEGENSTEDLLNHLKQIKTGKKQSE